MPLNNTIQSASSGLVVGSIQQVELYRSTLGSAGQFDFDSIPGTYDHLRIILNCRSSVSAVVDFAYIFCNNDTTVTNYIRQTTVTYGATAVGQQTNSPIFSDISGDTNTAGRFSLHIFDIPNYASTAIVKTISCASGQLDTSYIRTEQTSIIWNVAAAAITRVTIRPDGYDTDKFTANSFCQIIGIKTVS